MIVHFLGSAITAVLDDSIEVPSVHNLTARAIIVVSRDLLVLTDTSYRNPLQRPLVAGCVSNLLSSPHSHSEPLCVSNAPRGPRFVLRSDDRSECRSHSNMLSANSSQHNNCPDPTQ
jgi:hypothetical protein